MEHGGPAMVPASRLVSLVALVDTIPLPAPAPRRGRPAVYPDRLLLKAVAATVLKRPPTVRVLLAVLAEDTPEMAHIRAVLAPDCAWPARRTRARRLGARAAALPAQVADLRARLVGLLGPWDDCGRTVAVDSAALRARGGVRHK